MSVVQFQLFYEAVRLFPLYPTKPSECFVCFPVCLTQICVTTGVKNFDLDILHLNMLHFLLVCLLRIRVQRPLLCKRTKSK